MARWIRISLGIVYATALVGAPFAYAQIQHARFRNFRLVTPDVLYRSGQLNPEGLERIVHDYGIRTIVTLREDDAVEDHGDSWEQEYCGANAIRYVRILPHAWWVKKGTPPGAKAVEQFLDVLRNPKKYPQPVLIHCFAGMHRTGVFCAIYRMEFERWSPQDALGELRRCGYDNLDAEWDVRWFVHAYPSRWKRAPFKVANTPTKPR